MEAQEMIFTSKKLKAIFTATLLGLGLILCCGAAWGKDSFPKPTGAVNDFAGVIAPEYKDQMEKLAQEVWQKTGTAIVVATVATLGENEEINDYVNRLYRAWGIGKKGENKGVLMFLTVKERKMRIETGYGVEGILPDGLVGEIRDKYMLPFFRQNEYGKGMANGMIAIASVVAKDAGVTLTGNPVVEQPRRTKAAQKGGLNIWTIVIIIAALGLLLGTRQGREILPWLILMNMGGGRGGSDGGGFGSFGGGGFGGFGGGDSGGGGAGGDF